MVAAMSASHAPLVTAIAFQLSAALENYQMHIDGLKDPWSQRRQHDLVSKVFDEVRMLKGALPELSVPMVEVFIRHVELMKGLWLSGSNQEAGDMDELRRRHGAAVGAMRERCLRVFSHA